tara:strand:+ start:104 stop:514 length:411 start_codon:yes stop_codon:yes gene_type:complete
MENYLYFRSDATVGNDDDETAGSTMYPASSFRGMVSGTATALGVVADDADAFSMFFTPKGQTGGHGDADGASGDNVDVVVVAITTDNNQKAVMKSVVAALNANPGDGFVEIFDAVTGYKVNSDIEGVTIVHTVAAD